MGTAARTRRRKSIQALTTAELDQLVRAWDGIQKLPPEDENSFFKIGGYHGEPFRGAGWGNGSYWGGYCPHGNVLFPTWHRLYVLRLEDALRSVKGCANVTLPFWDEVSKDSAENGIPSVLTEQEYTFSDRTRIRNPLYSYTLQKSIIDHRAVQPGADYSKRAGYETVRYPLSGLVGTEDDRKRTEEHNKEYLADPARARKLLNENVITWLTDHPVIDGKPNLRFGLAREQYANSLKAPNYTVFSNITSHTEWNDHHSPPVTSLEIPHNAIHLAIGGFNIPNNPNFSPIPGANGDMGENETTSFDPIFYFHHCFVDLVFWQWQQMHDATKKIEIIKEYPGTNSVDWQGPTPGVAPNQWLDEDSPLDPFRKKDGSPYTSRDCVDIHALGYDYEDNSLPELLSEAEAADAAGATSASTVIHVSGIDRTKIKGSFLISAFANDGATRHHIGTEAVLSRWHVEGCANCQNHLFSSATFPVPDEIFGATNLMADSAYTLEVGITTHTEPATENLQALTANDTGEVLRTARTATADGASDDAGSADDSGVVAPFYAELRTVPSTG